ncbi:cellulose binding domain-containing protein [Ruminococcus bicirculans]|nr:cellulose binding domain-containing protein [Ruminococcus bicirculans (ex Wegman et al. 2014)]
MNVTNDWGNGFTGEIQNLSAKPIEAWRLNFDTNFTIEVIWNARMVSAEANSYSIANDITTTPIAANETKTFGFKALKERGVTAEIFNCIVNRVTINENFKSLEFLETGLVLTAFAQYN